MDRGVEAPVVEKPGLVEDIGDVGEAQEAVQSNQLVDWGGAGFCPDDCQDGQDEGEDDDTADDTDDGEQRGRTRESGHRPVVTAGS